MCIRDSADAVDHAVVCVIEQSELKFNHVSVLGIESGYVYNCLLYTSRCV